ncbi:MAG: O-antigen ligase family protein [Phycisphaerales bacterium JB047]
MDDAHGPMTLGERLAWLGLLLVALLCIARAMIEHDPFPWWQSDPFVFSPPLIGLTPRWALLFHILILSASIVFLIGQRLRGLAPSSMQSVLLLAALAALGYHAFIDTERVLGVSSVTAVACVLFIATQAHTLPGAQRVIGTVAIGFALMLAAVGVFEVFISHPQTIEAFEQGRDAFYAARGWSEHSFEALAYERRLRNPEPIAWFGLTNVFASFAAASGAGLLAIAIAAWRQHRPLALITGIAAIISITMLFLTGSKGGIGVLLLGLGLVAATTFTRINLLRGRTVMALCGLVLLGLIVRGLIGEGLGERSLLFRFQYLIGGLSIWLHDPLLGCGPGMFQDQYTLLKPDLSPEDVASPHSVVISWIATLGLGGIALTGLLIRLLLRLGPTEQTSIKAPASTPKDADRNTKMALLLVALPTLLALRMQTGVLSLQGMLALLLGAALWGGLSAGVIRSRVPDTLIRRGVLAAATVLIVHAMLEVTGTLIVSAPLWALSIGIACNLPVSDGKKRRGDLPALVGMLAIAVVLISRWGTINAWERSLHAGASGATGVAQVHSAVNDLEFSSDPQRDLYTISSMLQHLVGHPVGSTLDAIIPTLNQAEVNTRFGSVDHLQTALDARPGHTPTRISLSQQLLWLASVAQSSGQVDQSLAYWDRATGLFEGVALNAQGHRWAGNIWYGRVSAFPESRDHPEWMEHARDHWVSAAALSPHEPRIALKLMNVSLDLGDSTEAAGWAKRVIELHERTRLDPLRGLNPTDLARARLIAED